MDEQLIAEVQNHAVIYNRQKYFLNNVAAGKFESKEEAWTSIAMILGTDVETCKKRWKYLRERYVQQRKQGDPPAYEHLSRPYLEKMKFLDQHIQPRKSYRGSSSFLPSPNGNNPFGDFVESSRSNGSVNSSGYMNYTENYSNNVKAEPEHHTFQSFTNANKHETPAPFPLNQNQRLSQLNEGNGSNEYRDNGVNQIPSSSSSLKSPLCSPQPVDHNHNDSTEPPKRLRLEASSSRGDGGTVDSSDNEDTQSNQNNIRHINGREQFYQNDFLYTMYQQFPGSRQFRSSEQLLGELVTTELLKMTQEKRRSAQKRILEVLFFDD